MPWADLGLARSDALDFSARPLGYHVPTGVTASANLSSAAHAESYFDRVSPPRFTLATPPTVTAADASHVLTVKDHANHAQTLARNVVVVLIAYNKRFTGATGDEATNQSGSNTLYGGTYADTFDDQYAVIGGNQIKAAAGL